MGRIRIRHGDHEIELEGTDTFIRKQLVEFYSRVGMGPSQGKTPIREQLLAPHAVAKGGGKTPTPAEFFKAKGKNDGVSQILVFGKYLEQFRNRSEFTRKELNVVAREAKLPKDVHSQYFTTAVKQGLLRKQGQHYSLTLSAEELLAGK